MFRLLLIVLFIFSSQASWARQSCDWPFRTEITIRQETLNRIDNYPVDLVLTANNVHPDYQWTNNGDDLRIFSSNDLTALPFKINSWNANTKSAEIRVTAPRLRKNRDVTIFVYYGNEMVNSLSTTVTSLGTVTDRIKFHTRSAGGKNPNSKDAAKLIFNLGNDVSNDYGCSHPSDFTNVTNRNQGHSSEGDFIAYSKTSFYVDVAGDWGIRYGADFGYGGGLYVDGQELQAIWIPATDFWWNYSWNSTYALRGSIPLAVGWHELEVIGGELSGDGGVTLQFSRNYSGPTQYSTATWLPFTSSNIDIRSEACPISTLTVTYGTPDACNKDLALITSQASNQDWFVGSSHTLDFTVNNLEVSEPANRTTKVTINLPMGISLTGYTGTDWNCTGTSGTIECSYISSIPANSSSSVLSLTTLLSNSAPANSTLSVSAAVSGNAPDLVMGNNNQTFSINVIAPPSFCSNIKPGLLVKFFDITGYTPGTIQNSAEYQSLVTARATMSFLQGQTIFNNINGTGNPFSSTDNYFLAIFEGYYYSNTATTLGFGVDGDDAIEAWINGSIVSTFYGAHPAQGSAQNINLNVNLAQGFNSIEFRMQEIADQDEYYFYSGTQINNQTIIPASNFYHCAGDPNIQLSTSIEVTSDPINASNFKAIPGAEITYTVNVENLGQISTDLNSTELVQALAPNTQLFVGDFNPTGGPIIFTDGTGDTASGLSYVYTSLNNNTDSISFSTDGINFNHTVTNTNGYDTAITHFKLTLPGTMKPTFSGITPTFSFQYRVQVK